VSTDKAKGIRHGLLADLVGIYRKIDKRNDRRLTTCELIKPGAGKAKRRDLRAENGYFLADPL